MLRRSRLLGGWLLTVLLLAELTLPGGAIPARAATLPSSIRFVPVVSGLSAPTFITNAGDGSNRLFILQQTGQIRIFKNGSLLSTPFLSIAGLSGFTGLNGEQGLLGLAFDPHYTSNGFFYITYTTTHADPVFLYTTTLARYRVSASNPDVADPSTASVLLSIPKKYTNHNGGMLAFGPDGFLSMSMGDGGSGGDPDNNAQNLHTLLGKLLRLDVTSTPPPGQKYVIPPTNPFFSSADPAVKKEIWAYGLRNPWRFSFDRSTGDLFIADVGQNTEEEVDFQAASSAGGQNYGWHILEGNLCYDPSTGCVPPPGYVGPVATYDHGVSDSFGCSITGGYVYRGSASPTLEGVYFYGDFCSGKVLGLVRNPDSTWSSAVLASSGFSISTFGQDEQGEIYLADYGGGAIYRIRAATVSISGSVGVNGISLSYVDGTPRTAVSAADGSYSITVPYGWSGTVTPSNSCLSFNPLSLTYSNVINDQLAQNYSPSLLPPAGCALAGVSIAGTARGSYVVPPSGHAVAAFPGVFDGPVEVTGSANILPGARSIYKRSLQDTPGFPASLLTTDYWFPWYDFNGMSTWIVVGNTSSSSAADVQVWMGGSLVDSHTITAGGRWTPAYPGTFRGPVEVKSTNGVNILASERVLYNGGFQETLGLPASLLTSDYWYSWYDYQGMASWIVVGNTSSSQSANVEIWIAGSKIDSQTIAPNGHLVSAYPGTFSGPVEVKSTNGVNIVSSQRILYNGGFDETSGFPVSRLATDYFYTWYDFTGMSSWIVVVNPSGTQSADVQVTIAGSLVESHTIPANGRWTPSYPGTFNGPVEVKSTNGVKIFTSQRILYNSLFKEMTGFPAPLLGTDYWFPWYDFSGMSTWIVIVKP